MILGQPNIYAKTAQCLQMVVSYTGQRKLPLFLMVRYLSNGRSRGFWSVLIKFSKVFHSTIWQQWDPVIVLVLFFFFATCIFSSKHHSWWIPNHLTLFDRRWRVMKNETNKIAPITIRFSLGLSNWCTRNCANDSGTVRSHFQVIQDLIRWHFWPPLLHSQPRV